MMFSVVRDLRRILSWPQNSYTLFLYTILENPLNITYFLVWESGLPDRHYSFCQIFVVVVARFLKM